MENEGWRSKRRLEKKKKRSEPRGRRMFEEGEQSRGELTVLSGKLWESQEIQTVSMG